ncbi:MAG TPA: alpha/beta hydrolase [Abditibacteriaceae bacterium]|jgi:predicted esterase
MSTHDLSFVHRFVPAQNGDRRTLLLLHGTGGTEDDLLDIGRALLPTAALLSPRGKVLENGMPRFFRRLREGVFDVEDLKARTHELVDFVTAAGIAYEIDAQKIFAAGYSNGANIAGSTLLLAPGVLRGAVLLRSMVPLVPEQDPDLSSTRVWMGAGRRDPIVPAENTQRLAQMLQRLGAEVSLRWHAGGHELARDEIEDAATWLGQNFV